VFAPTGRPRQPATKVIIPDSATAPPATCTLNGYESSTQERDPRDGRSGRGRPGDDRGLAGIMITNPKHPRVSRRHPQDRRGGPRQGAPGLHGRRGNMNALVGVLQAWHHRHRRHALQPAQTMSIPTARGPGSGPIAVRRHLEPYLPAPRVKKHEDGRWGLDYNRPRA